jgi:hypothetical protein
MAWTVLLAGTPPGEPVRGRVIRERSAGGALEGGPLDAGMTVQQLQAMIDAADAAAEEDEVLGRASGWYAEELFAAWSAARAEANLAYAHWCAEPGADAYATFRAAEDRADAAEQAFARCVTGGRALPLPVSV